MDYESLKALAEPDCYARVRLGFELYPWQEKILRAMSGGVYNGIVSNAYQILGGTYSNTVVHCSGGSSASGGTFCGNVVFANNVKLNGGTYKGNVSVLSGSQVWSGTLNGISSLTLWDSPEMRPLSKWPVPERGINGSAILGMP